MNIEAIFAEGEERFTRSRIRENEGKEDTFVISTAAPIKEESGGGARLPSAIGLPFCRKEPPDAEKRLASLDAVLNR